MLDEDATVNEFIHFFYKKRLGDFEMRTVRMTLSFWENLLEHFMLTKIDDHTTLQCQNPLMSQDSASS